MYFEPRNHMNSLLAIINLPNQSTKAPRRHNQLITMTELELYVDLCHAGKGDPPVR